MDLGMPLPRKRVVAHPLLAHPDADGGFRRVNRQLCPEKVLMARWPGLENLTKGLKGRTTGNEDHGLATKRPFDVERNSLCTRKRKLNACAGTPARSN